MNRISLLAIIALGACALDASDARWQSASEREAELAIESDLIPVAPLPESQTLRIATFNVQFGRRIGALAELLAAPPFDQIDAFLIQEIEVHPSEGQSRAAELAELTGMAFVYLPARPLTRGTHGMAILARHPLSDVRFIDLPFFGTSIRRDRRVALAVEMLGIDVVNVHLRVQLGIAERVVQLEPSTRELRDLAVLGGDLNTNNWAWSDVIPIVPTEPLTDVDVPRVIDDVMVNFAFDAASADSGPTHDTPAGSLRLDSIYSRGFEPLSVQVERDVELSDHWPVWVALNRL